MLIAQVNDGKFVTFIKVDNGSDWELNSMAKEYCFFKLWKDCGSDIFLGW